VVNISYKKSYGSYQRALCPFCKKEATTKNSQKIPVCQAHKNAVLGEMKCICGNYLVIMEGKYGIFFNCIKCGNISPSKVFEINEVVDVSKDKDIKEPSPKETGPKFFNDKTPSVEKGVCVENYESKFNF
jgi:hypothetical protein